jgi:hypothetical protein
MGNAGKAPPVIGHSLGGAAVLAAAAGAEREGVATIGAPW